MVAFIVFLVLIPILLFVVVPAILLSIFRRNQSPMTYVTEADWQLLTQLESKRTQLIERVRILQTIIIKDFPHSRVTKIDDEVIIYDKNGDVLNQLNQLTNNIEKLENHIFQLETVLDSNLPSWRVQS